MNERTKALFNKALDQAVPETWTTLSYEQMTKLSQVFAELIVLECAEIALVDGQSTGNFDTFNKIQKHFGVEE